MNSKTIALTLITFVGLSAQASHVVCSAPTLYYSSTRIDTGVAPPPGTDVGKLVIFAQGKLLVDVTYTEGLGGFPTPKYGVTFAGPKTVLSKTGSQVAGTAIYTDTAVLSTLAPFPQQEVLRTPVVCEQAWALFP